MARGFVSIRPLHPQTMLNTLQAEIEIVQLQWLIIVSRPDLRSDFLSWPERTLVGIDRNLGQGLELGGCTTWSVRTIKCS